MDNKLVKVIAYLVILFSVLIIILYVIVKNGA
jgi:preprotein translocase subunit SecG